mmetsp:Transcript_24060/g.45708  ORF Transcript_24060/g.45708 Transcript_24060/m.45708 type:complete len:242 (-) Transcript_24060:3279-4004(-)
MLGLDECACHAGIVDGAPVGVPGSAFQVTRKMCLGVPTGVDGRGNLEWLEICAWRTGVRKPRVGVKVRVMVGGVRSGERKPACGLLRIGRALRERRIAASPTSARCGALNASAVWCKFVGLDATLCNTGLAVAGAWNQPWRSPGMSCRRPRPPGRIGVLSKDAMLGTWLKGKVGPLCSFRAAFRVCSTSLMRVSTSGATGGPLCPSLCAASMSSAGSPRSSAGKRLRNCRCCASNLAISCR